MRSKFDGNRLAQRLIPLFAAGLLYGCASESDPDSSILPAQSDWTDQQKTVLSDMKPIPPATRGDFAYPPAPRTNQVDSYHGTLVEDPYRPLEDDNAPQTKDWAEAENKLTFDFLDKIPERPFIKERLTELWNFERFGVPFKQGGRYFITRNNGLQNQAVLYSMTAADAQPVELLDPNTLSADGTVALAGYSVSDDGNYLAYGLSRAGSDWEDWKVRDVSTGKDLPDEIHWVKFSGASWTKDSKGFFYSRYDQPDPANAMKGVNYYQKLYYHEMGAEQSVDKLIYERKDQKEWGFGASVTEDGRYVVITVSQGTDTRNRVFYIDREATDRPVIELISKLDAAYHFIGNVGTQFYFQTDLNAPSGRVISIDLSQPQRGNWREVIPETSDRLQGVSLVNDQLIADYLQDAHSAIKIFTRDSKLMRAVELPGIGTASGFGGKREDTETFYSFTSFTTPATIYRYDLAKGESTVFRQPKLQFNPADYETKQIFYTSKDGTRVPMFITARKGLRHDGSNPAYLYAYGGFDISITPAFSAANLLWMEMGGVYAVPNIRGGGEYGEAWHRGGMKSKKQNVFDDFIAAAQWLINSHYTSTPKLAIGGGSNGGLLVGACLTQRPDLYGAALPAVGVMDMLRFQKFTIGWAWTSDYGSSDNPTEFKTLRAYSPLHNVVPGTDYPPTLITTGDHDDRVVPAHSFKFAAALQDAQAGPAPILIRVETRAGHGAGKPTAKIIAEAADKWAFLVQELKMHPSNLVTVRLTEK